MKAKMREYDLKPVLKPEYSLLIINNINYVFWKYIVNMVYVNFSLMYVTAAAVTATAVLC